MYVCVYVCMYVCMYVYMSILTISKFWTVTPTGSQEVWSERGHLYKGTLTDTEQGQGGFNLARIWDRLTGHTETTSL